MFKLQLPTNRQFYYKCFIRNLKICPNTISFSRHHHCVRLSLFILHPKSKTIQFSLPILAKQEVHTSTQNYTSDKESVTAIALRYKLFEEIQEKNKETFIQALELFEAQSIERRGHVEFIYSAMEYLEEFGVHKDLETYKKLMNIFPKGVFVIKTVWQREFQHYPKQQQCAVDLLDEMEMNGVLPDREMKDILLATFGNWSFPLRKFYRIMYWMPKFRHLSPWPLPNPAPVNPLELAKLAIARISSVDLQSKVTVFKTKELEEALDDTWIVSVQSPSQQKLIAKMTEKITAFVEGPFQIYIRQHMVNYFLLRTDPKENPQMKEEDLDDVSNLSIWMYENHNSSGIVPNSSVHEQEEGVILGIGASGTSSHDSLISWIQFLQQNNPQLAKMPIVFSLRSPAVTADLVSTDSSKEKVDKRDNKMIE